MAAAVFGLVAKKISSVATTAFLGFKIGDKIMNNDQNKPAKVEMEKFDFKISNEFILIVLIIGVVSFVSYCTRNYRNHATQTPTQLKLKCVSERERKIKNKKHCRTFMRMSKRFSEISGKIQRDLFN